MCGEKRKDFNVQSPRQINVLSFKCLCCFCVVTFVALRKIFYSDATDTVILSIDKLYFHYTHTYVPDLRPS